MEVIYGVPINFESSTFYVIFNDMPNAHSLMRKVLSASDTNLFYSGDNLFQVCGGFRLITFHEI